MSKSPCRGEGSIAIMGRLLVQKEVQVEKTSAGLTFSLASRMTSMRWPKSHEKLTLINSCTLLPINSVLESHQRAVQFRRWYLLSTRFLTPTAWKSQELISDFAHVVLPKWAETISNIWRLSHFFINFKRCFSVMLKLLWITTDALSL